MALREMIGGLLGRTSAEQADPVLDDEQTRAAWLVASWLLQYPDEGAYGALPSLDALARTLPDPVREELRGVIRALTARDPYEVRAEYVETFDTRRRGCLYLTYFANGDTRRRGMALLEVKQRYRDEGLEVSDDELPDHLAYVLEFGAAHSVDGARGILLAHRAGLELLRLHLQEAESPWQGAVAAVCRTLPPLDGDDRAAIARLAAEGPAEEEVGLTDGAEDMPPMDMTPYATGSAPAGTPGRAFFPIDSLTRAPLKGRPQ
ncbi:nitrate reductase molybdenum cofactor assembly chaperone [Microbacterium suaedae]|uniref:nitrate reductase molybdenum cofactor assembly chaperone n=1 Tax=Microbacterium suaedae TaxID=2067813 RepID=UPI001E65173F|nr:nitrate reductase molybdenum cofactor assembly chaperone [Microbacterium suaedae]